MKFPDEILVKFFVNETDPVLAELLEEGETTFTGDGGTQIAHLEKATASALIADVQEMGYGCAEALWKRQTTRSGKSGCVVTCTFRKGAMSGHDTVIAALKDRGYHHVYVWDNGPNVTVNFVAPAGAIPVQPVRADETGFHQ